MHYTMDEPNNILDPCWLYRKIAKQEIDAFGREREPKMADLVALPYLDACWREGLRLFPPGIIALREAMEDLNLGGFLVPRGTDIHVCSPSKRSPWLLLEMTVLQLLCLMTLTADCQEKVALLISQCKKHAGGLLAEIVEDIADLH